MKKITLCFVAVFMFLGIKMALAQYTTAIGARVGSSNGLNVLQYFNPTSRGAANFNLASKYQGVLFTGLYEVHSKNHNLNIELANVGFFWGIGGHLGSFKGQDYGVSKKSVFAVGVDATAGVEWKIPGAPLLLSADLRPYYEWVKDVDEPLDFLDYGLSLRYVFR